MIEITVKETCPHCCKDTVVYSEKKNGEKESGVLQYRSCQHCGSALRFLSYPEKEWFIARNLKPKEIE